MLPFRGASSNVSPGLPNSLKGLRIAAPFFFHSMHLLYVDESGTVSDANQQYFVLAGVSVFERTCHWIESSLNETIKKYFDPQDIHSLELHASPMRSGKNEWRKFKREDRENAIVEALSVGVAQQNRGNVRLFAAVIRKADLPADAAENAFTQLYSRFDQFLRRLHLSGNTQRGIMIFDKTSIEPRIQTLAREFKTAGHPWGRTRNYAEVPLFLDSKASRLIQLADLIAFAIFRHFEHHDSRYFDVIRHCFDEEGGVVHGLHVYQRDADVPDDPIEVRPVAQDWLPRRLPIERAERYARE
ncbi:DUF3800 domain-containing protein [Paraburkholderia sp. C35]|uniref:DUF3800 domain-containing protein n=1 Tax=Paraburkholderia sp. C35 TaxID=2126993 RepID=UPI00195252C8|nr:DUF3800 domain-containing protein [Paraburkholderia sp. C35]